MFNKIRQYIVEHKFLSLLFANCLFFIVAAYLLPIRFEENDDVIMLLFASGKYTGTPEAHLVFINYIYGHVLKFLYSERPGIEWYSVLFALINIISITVISWSILNKRQQNFYVIIFLAIFYLLEIRFIELFQFTTIAAICALAGIILIICNKNYQRTTGSVLFILASLIRFDAAFLVLLIISPVFLQFVFINKKFLFAKPIRFLLIAIGFSFFFKFLDNRSLQNDKSWKYYSDYNKERGKINDNPNTALLIQKLPSNISSSDLNLLAGFLPDGKTMNLQKLRLINSRLNFIPFKDKIAHIPDSLWSYKFFLLGLTIACIGLIYMNRIRMNRIILLISLLVFLLTLFYISLNASPKARVFLSSMLPLFYVMFYTTKRDINIKVNLMFLIGITFFTVLFIKQNIFTWNSSRNYRQTDFAEQKTLLKEYLQNKQNTIVPVANTFHIEYYPVFAVSKHFKSNQIFFSGWATNIPFNHSYFTSYLDLINRHALFLAKDAYNWIISKLIQSIYENYGIKVIPQIQIESKDYLIVKLTSNKILGIIE
jgi:hypothetical protein